MSAPRTFEQLVAEGDAVPVDGWDFSWFEGRATEQRPSWGYAGLIAGRMASAAEAAGLRVTRLCPSAFVPRSTTSPRSPTSCGR